MNDTLTLCCFQHFYHNDQANAAIHLAEVRYSPITFRLAEALGETPWETDEVRNVLRHLNTYELDHGR